MNDGADVSCSTRRVVDLYLGHLRSGAPPEKLAALFSEDVDWYIAGDVGSVPWLGRRNGRAGVAEFFTLFRKGVQPVRVELEEPLVSGERAVVLATFDSLLTASGRVVTSEGALVMRVRDGLIVQYRVLEDSYAVSQTQR
jgi:ketosteroid isomerase-like protein